MPLRFNISNRSAADFVTEIGQCALNPVSPTSDCPAPCARSIRDLTHDARSASASSLGKVPLLRKQAPMPLTFYCAPHSNLWIARPANCCGPQAQPVNQLDKT